MVYWRGLKQTRWMFGYCTYTDNGYSMVRMGSWNGDTTGGSVVDISDIEWRPYENHR
jgi:hypothetical protein